MFETLIQLFAKPPRKGRVKTRLIPAVGAQAALDIYQHCLQHNLRLLRDSGYDYQLWLNEPTDQPQFSQYPVFYQQGQNLGEKMFFALSTQLENSNNTYHKVLLMGADCLELTGSMLKKVEDKLDQHDLVIIPALDGGYVLIAAANSINPAIFEQISWGTEKVLSQTLEQAMANGINTFVLNPLRDIDRPEDLQHYPTLKHYF